MSVTTYLTVKFIQVREDSKVIRSLAFFTVTPVFQMTMKDAVTSALNENQFDNYVGQVNKLINKIHLMNGNQLSLKYAESHYPNKSDKMIQKKDCRCIFLQSINHS